MKYSLWGKVEHAVKLQQGMYLVSTSTHGGIMISIGQADKILSEAAIKRGERFGGYLCYEEDCLWAIIAYEFPELVYSHSDHPVKSEEHYQQWKNKVFESLSHWNAGYLIKRGITPDEDGYKAYRFREEYYSMRRSRNPKLIVSASRINDIKTKVWTADDQEYIVEGYQYPRPNYQHNLLDFCKVVAEM
jgi:hypothetical protein